MKKDYESEFISEQDHIQYVVQSASTAHEERKSSDLDLDFFDFNIVEQQPLYM
jgi:hypothetical protein